MTNQSITKILHFGERYKNEHLKCVSKQDLERDWYGGLSLLLSDSFYQGRRDEVSEKVEGAAMGVLNKYFSGRDVSALAGCDFDLLLQDLLAVIGKGKTGKSRDAYTVVGIFRFVSQLQEKNLTRYSIAVIELGGVQQLSEELQGITGIGPKISSLYLRDLADIYNLESKIAPEDLRFLQPIDVWVRKLALKTGIAGDEQLSDAEIQRKIVGVCHGLGVSALRFNQGAWYLGKNAFEILVENLDSLRLRDSAAV